MVENIAKSCSCKSWHVFVNTVYCILNVLIFNRFRKVFDVAYLQHVTMAHLMSMLNACVLYFTGNINAKKGIGNLFMLRKSQSWRRY